MAQLKSKKSKIVLFNDNIYTKRKPKKLVKRFTMPEDKPDEILTPKKKKAKLTY